MYALRWLLLAMVLCVTLTPISGWGDGSKLTPGDVIAVTVDGEKDFSKPYQVNQDGMISMPMVKMVSVGGMSTSEAAQQITKTLKAVLISPQVTVSFVERARMQVFVIGQVRKPGIIQIGTGDRVVQALAQAGYDDTADLSHVSLRRGGTATELDVKKYLSGERLDANLPLQSGDTIVVPRADMAGTVMVLGHTAKTGFVPVRKGMTFRELMGLIGDVTVEADTEKITIKHENATERVSVNYKRAMDGDPSADIVLQPGDTIYVPQIETSFFTVLGGVGRPGQYPVKGKITLTEAIGLAGGAVPNVGDLRKVQVMSPPEGDAKAVTKNYDLTKTLSFGAEQPVVRRGEVIYVTQHKQRPGIMDVLGSALSLSWLFL